LRSRSLKLDTGEPAERIIELRGCYWPRNRQGELDLKEILRQASSPAVTGATSVVEIYPPVLHRRPVRQLRLVVEPREALEPVHVPGAAPRLGAVLRLPRIELRGIVRGLHIRASRPVVQPVVLASREHRLRVGLIVVLTPVRRKMRVPAALIERTD